MQRRTLTLAVLANLSMTAVGTTAAQQPAPLLNKPLKVVVGFPPGGSADTVARALVQQLEGLAPSVIVENKPGAGGRLAVETVKNAEADGSTVVLTPASMVVLYPHLYKKLSYNPTADLAPVARVAAAPFVFAVGPAVPASVKTLAEFGQWAKTNPNLGAYGSSGAGSMPHFTGVSLGKSRGIDLLHVAYKGAAPAMTDLIGGQVAANVSVMSNALPQIQAGKVRALAVSSPQRVPALPQIPTLAELGHGEATAVEWFGVFAPAKTPANVVAALNKAFGDAAQSKAFQEALAKGAFEAVPAEAPAAFAAAVQADINRWGPVVKASGFTPED
ncbi:Bug family tripartite tricarboxylate transporter substrate binding protein [Hydrogenophaga flava]|uniref:Bug family tripartite tricarboxylate transporter substrate binding protein n=1 Tax=Hydrogenophaga flava TaxID=65657 RepID=UPI0008258056|nr:tripartite tricarboxylate transporter substrate-binding protein [Hydrogenophaga flava]